MNTVFNMLNAARRIAVDIVDDQIDFTHISGALSINPAYGCKEDASEVVEPTNVFLTQLPQDVIDFALVKFDTHFPDEYPRSPESGPFPNPHCLYATPGWNLSVNLKPLLERVPTYMLAKNGFDMWGNNPTGLSVDQLSFSTAQERTAYQNLFKVIPLRAGDDPALRLASAQDGQVREAFMATQKVGRGTVVILLGVASDICDSFAIAGYLDRGASVLVADDLTRGIGAPATAAPRTGSMNEVVNEHFAQTHPQAVAEGRLVLATADTIVDGLRKLQGQRVQYA